jgi:hypothetical protein
MSPLEEALRGALARNAPADYPVPSTPDPCPYCGAIPFDGSVWWAPGEALAHALDTHPELFPEDT